MGPERVRAPKLADVVAERLCDWLLEGRFRQGDKLPSEQVLMGRLGVGRTVVREALGRLKGLGIVEVHHGKGVFISPVPIELLGYRIRKLKVNLEQQLPHVWEMRELFEASIAELAALRRTPEDLGNLLSSVQTMQEAIAEGETAVKEDGLFHLFLTLATHNPVLVQVMEDISTLVDPTRQRSLERPGRSAASLEEHRLILAAVERRDPQAAREAMKRHLRTGKLLTTAAEREPEPDGE